MSDQREHAGVASIEIKTFQGMDGFYCEMLVLLQKGLRAIPQLLGWTCQLYLSPLLPAGAEFVPHERSFGILLIHSDSAACNSSCRRLSWMA